MFAAAISHEKFGALWSAVRHSVGRVCFGAEAVTYAGASLFSTSASHLPGTENSWLTQHWHLEYENMHIAAYRNWSNKHRLPGFACKMFPQDVAVVERC